MISALELRRKFCQREIEVNKALCGDMYKGVIKVVSQNSSVRVGNLSCKGKALEYAVKMREIPQEYRMDDLIKADKVSLKTIEKLARISVKFHSSARTSPKITNY